MLTNYNVRFPQLLTYSLISCKAQLIIGLRMHTCTWCAATWCFPMHTCVSFDIEIWWVKVGGKHATCNWCVKQHSRTCPSAAESLDSEQTLCQPSVHCLHIAQSAPWTRQHDPGSLRQPLPTGRFSSAKINSKYSNNVCVGDAYCLDFCGAPWDVLIKHRCFQKGQVADWGAQTLINLPSGEASQHASFDSDSPHHCHLFRNHWPGNFLNHVCQVRPELYPACLHNPKAARRFIWQVVRNPCNVFLLCKSPHLSSRIWVI